MARYRHGFVLGKFMPLHAGHIYLLDAAQSQCDELTILLCSQPDDPINGDIRFEWLQTQFPEAHVVHHPKPLPRDQTNPQFWELWQRSIREYCPDTQFDAVFSSETYGQRLAEALGAPHHVEVDIARSHVPISGTEIRKDPMGNLRFLTQSVRDYYRT